MNDWIDQAEDAIRDVDFGNVTTIHHRQGHMTKGIVIRRTDTYPVASLPDGLELIGETIMNAATAQVTGTIEIKATFEKGRIKTVFIERPVDSTPLRDVVR